MVKHLNGLARKADRPVSVDDMNEAIASACEGWVKACEFSARYPAHMHLEKHRRSLALHHLIAERIRRDHSLLDKARATMDRWMKNRQQDRPEPYYITEWRTVIEQGIDATLALMTNPSERATDLRQSSPFSGILTNEERLAFLAKWRAQNPRAS